jgi:hypothetical protein
LHAQHPAPRELPTYWPTPTFKASSLLVILVVSHNSSTAFTLSSLVTTAGARDLVVGEPFRPPDKPAKQTPGPIEQVRSKDLMMRQIRDRRGALTQSKTAGS